MTENWHIERTDYYTKIANGEERKKKAKELEIKIVSLEGQPATYFDSSCESRV